jgi:protein-S-isoprenylcysteine O-methyltransferase Ste14
MFAIIELCIIVAGTTKSESTWSKRVTALLLPNGKHPDCIRLTPTTTFAMILMVLGSAIRYWCFREMGRYFTFHVTLFKDHKLVTTGPYSIVRHPSYTGAIFLGVGQVIWYTARGSWVRESMIYQIKLSWFLIAPVILSIFLALACIPRRMPVEDATLKKAFGKAWDEWAKAVPYRLFPGVY